MKKIKLLFLTFVFLSFSLMGEEPSLTTKDLSTSPAIPSSVLNYGIGTRKLIANTSFIPTGDYTVEVKAKLLSSAVNGLLLETRNSARTGFRMSINSNGVDNYGALNYTNETAITNLSAVGNDAATFHTFRFAVEGTNVHIYRDGVYVTSTTTEQIYIDNLLKDSNGNFESEDMSMWYFNSSPAGQGRTTTAGESRNGTAAVKLKNTNNTSVISSLTIKGLKPNTTYAFSCYAKYLIKSVNNGSMAFITKTGYYNSSSVFVPSITSSKYSLVGMPNTSMDAALATWTYNGRSFTTGASDSIAVFDFYGSNGTNTYVFDDFVLSEVEVTPTTGATIGSNIVTNGDFATDAAGWPAGAWPLGAVSWGATGLLQIKEAAWVAASDATYSVPVTVSPNKTYKLTATTWHKAVATTRSIRLADGAATASTDYAVPTGAFAASYTNSTPAISAGPATTSLTMQFTGRTNSSVATPIVVMQLDNVEVQEYEATYPSYLKYGKAYQSEATNIEIDYINYDLTGAYAPYDVSTSLTHSNKNLILSVQDGKLSIKGVKAGDKVEVFNSLGMRILTTLAQEGDNQYELKAKGVLIVKVNNTLNKVIL